MQLMLLYRLSQDFAPDSLIFSAVMLSSDGFRPIVFDKPSSCFIRYLSLYLYGTKQEIGSHFDLSISESFFEKSDSHKNIIVEIISTSPMQKFQLLLAKLRLTTFYPSGFPQKFSTIQVLV